MCEHHLYQDSEFSYLESNMRNDSHWHISINVWFTAWIYGVEWHRIERILSCTCDMHARRRAWLRRWWTTRWRAWTRRAWTRRPTRRWTRCSTSSPKASSARRPLCPTPLSSRCALAVLCTVLVHCSALSLALASSVHIFCCHFTFSERNTFNIGTNILHVIPYNKSRNEYTP